MKIPTSKCSLHGEYKGTFPCPKCLGPAVFMECPYIIKDIKIINKKILKDVDKKSIFGFFYGTKINETLDKWIRVKDFRKILKI